MKRAVLWTTGFIALTATFAARAYADQKNFDERFCGAAAVYQSDIAELEALAEHSTMAQVRAAQPRIDTHVMDMTTAAAQMRKPPARTFVEATRKLDKDIDIVPDDVTLEQVGETIRGDVTDAQIAAEQVAAEAGCPPMPRHAPKTRVSQRTP